MTILVCDDDKEIVEAISIYLKQEGYNIIPAYNGKEALQVMEKEEIHLIILDIMMPHLDGFSVCKLAREMGNLPILFLTAKSDEEDKLRGYEYGADDYVTKPFSLKLLLAKINALLRRTGNISQDGLVAFGAQSNGRWQ